MLMVKRYQNVTNKNRANILLGKVKTMTPDMTKWKVFCQQICIFKFLQRWNSKFSFFCNFPLFLIYCILFGMKYDLSSGCCHTHGTLLHTNFRNLLVAFCSSTMLQEVSNKVFSEPIWIFAEFEHKYLTFNWRNCSPSNGNVKFTTIKLGFFKFEKQQITLSN